MRLIRKLSSENHKLLGEEGYDLFNENFEPVETFSIKPGGMQPDLVYKPGVETTKIAKD